MFIKSKYARNFTIFNVDFIIQIDKKEFIEPDKTYWALNIVLNTGSDLKWHYETEEQRDAEYSWVLSQLDCRVNEENVTGPIITRISPADCKCGGHGYLTTHSMINIQCDKCTAHAYSELSVEHVWKLWDNMQLKMD